MIHPPSLCGSPGSRTDTPDHPEPGNREGRAVPVILTGTTTLAGIGGGDHPCFYRGMEPGRDPRRHLPGGSAGEVEPRLGGEREMTTVVRRTFGSTPHRDAGETWRAIIDLLTQGKTGAKRDELLAVHGVASSIIADKAPKDAAIVVSCDGPRA